MSNNSNHQTEGTAHVHRDDFGAKMGMWLFLFTELILFGGLFIVYMGYRVQYPDAFYFAAKELNVSIGALNTIILLTSSLTMVLSIVAMQKKDKKLSVIFLILTEIFALAFLAIKTTEWLGKIAHGIYPGSPELLNKENGEIIFFGLYYTMTGLHGLHIIIGLIILTFNLVFILRNKITPDNYVKLENAGLYWHLVDLIWIFLFPLFYLLH